MDNSVKLIGWYGGDEAIACSAWTSTSRDLTPEKRERIPTLIRQLWNAEPVPHGTPFEKGMVHFLVNCDIASHIHLLKHRISSINAECLTGDNLITFVNADDKTNKKLKKSVKDLYDSWNSGRKHQDTHKDMLYNRKRIQQMKLRVLDESTGLFSISHIADIWEKGIQKVFKITLENGSSIKCTENHSIYTSDGYLTISEGLSVGHYVGCNGVQLEVKEKPYTFEDFYKDAHLYTRKEFAENKGLKYELIKKWGYIFKVKFKEDLNKDFKKGQIPWNKDKKGTYSINIANRKHNPLKGDRSNFWRGGVSKERDLIGAWTTSKASEVHKKYSYTCQCCGKANTELHAHHVIPVVSDISKAYDFNNLITVCKECHIDIHKSVENEIAFANKILDENFNPKTTNWGKNPKRIGGKLSVHYSPIVSIEFVGEEQTYDIEVVGNNNNFVANNIVVHNSARYKELKEDKYYIPEDWPEKAKKHLIGFTQMSNQWYHQYIAELTPILGRKRAKESARFFKTYNSQIESDVMFNMRSFHNFLTQRMDDHAQVEIQEIARQMLDLVKNIEGNPFKHTLNAWGL